MISERLPKQSIETSAFSLIELLVVMAILGLLVTFSVVGFQSIGTSRGVSQAAADVAGLLEYARNEAVTRRSYVWVGLKETNISGSLEVQMAAAYSIDGTTNTGTNLTPLSRIMKVGNTGLMSYSGLRAETRDLLGSSIGVQDFSTNTRGVTFKVGANEFKNTITFTPRGEALLKGVPVSFDGFDPMIGIGLMPARGSVKADTSKDAAVVLDGSTGMARVLRL